MDPDKKEESPYGQNVGTKDASKESGIREEKAKTDPDKGGNAEAFEETRKKAADESETHGGMGRVETPRDGSSQGEWHRPNES